MRLSTRSRHALLAVTLLTALPVGCDGPDGDTDVDAPDRDDPVGDTDDTDVVDTDETDTDDTADGDDTGTADTDTDTDTDTGVAPGPTAACDPVAPLTTFVTRDGDQLFDDGVPFRFVSVNVPDLLGIVDPAWAIPTPWEQEDGLCAVRQLGGKVARTYVISVGDPSGGVPRHVTAPGVLDEDQMVAMDEAIAAAGRQGVRLVVPLVDQWSWVGGTTEYAAFRGLSQDDFWTDATVRADFLETVRFVVSRVNTVTGVPYAEDPAILAWETGNELDAPADWTAEVAAAIKDLDPNHLVVDGTFGIEMDNLDNEDIDVVSNHYYWPADFRDDYAAAAAADRATSLGRRPFIVGEFGIVPAWRVEGLLTAGMADGVTGIMAWSLRFHDEAGGFYWHTEYDDGTTAYKAYRWPGFASGDAWEERTVLDLLRDAVADLDGVPVALPPPAPTLLADEFDGTLSWRGSAGADTYTLARADAADGPWVDVASGFTDADAPNTASVADPSGVGAGGAWYRLTALGAGGASEPSAVYGPVVTGALFEDPLADLSLVYDADTALRIDGTNASLFGGDTGRLTRSSAGDRSVVWGAEGLVTGVDLLAYAWPSEPTPTLGFATSPDGETWTDLVVTADELGGDWRRLRYRVEALPADTRYVRVTLAETGGNTWTPQIGAVGIRYTP